MLHYKFIITNLLFSLFSCEIFAFPQQVINEIDLKRIIPGKNTVENAITTQKSVQNKADMNATSKKLTQCQKTIMKLDPSSKMKIEQIVPNNLPKQINVKTFNSKESAIIFPDQLSTSSSTGTGEIETTTLAFENRFGILDQSRKCPEGSILAGNRCRKLQ